MTSVAISWTLGALLVVLAGAAAAVAAVGRVGSPTAIAVAAARAVVQLAGVSAIIGVVLGSGWLTALFLLVMTVVASATSARRVTGSLRPAGWWCALPIAGGVVPVLALVIASGVVPWRTVAVLPVAGILLGGAMTATSLGGRRVADELASHRDSYEGLLALGVVRRAAARFLARPAAASALVPGLDQTRTVGLVTLPGAFVGVLLAGASPLRAGAAQVLVLVGLLLVQTIAVTATVELVAAGLLPAGEHRLAR